MTLIAGFYKNNCPILMGDLLVSDTEESDKILRLPSVGEISKKEFSNGEYSPSHLSQKAILINSKLAICWAGTRIYAKSFIEEIIKNNLHDNPSYESLRDLYNEINASGAFSVIGLYRNRAEMRIFDFNSRRVLDSCPNSDFSYFQATGSGYDTLLAIMPNVEMSISSGNPNELVLGISTALSLSSALLSQELMTRSSLKELFGVGYEIIHPLGSGLNKFSDVSYIFWHTHETTPGKWQLSFPSLILKYSYISDFLVIRSVRCSSEPQKSSCSIDSDEIHVVNPIHRNIDSNIMIGYKPKSLNSKCFCNVFLWKNLQNETGAYAQFSNNTPPIILENEFTKDAGIRINSKFLKSSLDQVLHMASKKLTF